MCLQIGITKEARVVDHIKPHKGNTTLFYKKANLMPLCPHCHSSIKQRKEKSGHLIGSKLDGSPMDKDHHWNA